MTLPSKRQGYSKLRHKLIKRAPTDLKRSFLPGYRSLQPLLQRHPELRKFVNLR